ncbi:hypothetical protein Dalk_1868 [Desulfatibacillum aliphaticivorans]|uniref:KaiC-like domain-containing protein n=1 Tax=Desulfatibacillum aliphaticivorans TaxID=218208 RepID=B8FEN8_DESAL|nr:ATPase domain-containing protein [Desulfatibacillum aliphaticivorans]ACL03565.1 hypothetical protein Dalk_1868 [Desulfatibacillum aliphaticivorans]
MFETIPVDRIHDCEIVPQCTDSRPWFRERGEFHLLHEWILDSGLTAMVTVKANAGAQTARHHEFLEYMADCVVYLDQRVSEQVVTRRLREVKYRGSAYGRNAYPFGITGRGLWIIPVTQTDLQHRTFGESIPSGVEGLDIAYGNLSDKEKILALFGEKHDDVQGSAVL